MRCLGSASSSPTTSESRHSWAHSQGWLGDSDPCLVSSRLSEPEAAGRDLAKLSLIAHATRDAVSDCASRGAQSPDILARIESTAEESLKLVRAALQKAGNPCTAEELAKRVNKDILSVEREALDFRDLLRAGELRDELELVLMNLDVMPPKESLIDGSGKTLSKPERREERRKALAADQMKAGEMEPGDVEAAFGLTDRSEAANLPSSTTAPKCSIPQLSSEELARRRDALVASSKIENVLKGFDTALLEVSRVHKVNKGGTALSMRALVVIGNRNGTAGYGEGKSENAPHAIERACRDAKRNLLYVDRYKDRTIYHRSEARYVRSLVTMWPMPKGRGILANNSFSAVFQLFGIKDVGAKLHGPRSVTNSVKALFKALHKTRSAEEVASTRGVKLLTAYGAAQPSKTPRHAAY